MQSQNFSMKKSSLLGIIVIAIAIGVIISTYADSSTYGTFAEAKSSESELHVVGKLDKEKPLEYDPQKDANLFSFYMKDNNNEEMKVQFIGSKPQDFERSEQIVVTGEVKGTIFQASKILMKCPSKYNKDQVEVSAK